MARDRGQANPPTDRASGDLVAIRTELGWIKKTGWRIAGIYAIVFGGLITWYLPKELTALRESVKGDTVNQIHPLQEQLANIEGQLRILTASQNSKSLKELSGLDQKTFSASLPVLRKVIEQPVSQVKLDRDTLRHVGEKLRLTDESSPDYWPTVLQFIQFASSAITPSTDVPPPGTPYSIISGISCSGLAHCIVASHQALLLDGGNIPGSIFDHCRIKFTNNQVGLAGVRFTDCVFEMPITSTPNPYLKDAARVMIAGNLLNITFPKF